ncbi:MAG: hypothetical protein LBC88_05535 [Spirochaetaceae bacterium]|jgi:hypothetical protein|nr:hypothetical protein [Spirochaetaceae bacterium]
MKRKLFGIAGLAILLVMGSCATYSTRDGVRTPIGAFTSPKINASRPVIAEYRIILGLVTSGYEEFLEATKGKDVDIIDTNYFSFFRKIQAVARE